MHAPSERCIAPLQVYTAHQKRLDTLQVGHDFFRIHPKGVGCICLRPEGLPPLTLVEEYLGEMHAPWRWFEIQVHQLQTAQASLLAHV